MSEIKTLKLDKKQLAALERIVAYVVLNEEVDFLCMLPKHLPNDVDCSPEVELQALQRPFNIDTKHRELYTCAMLIGELL